MKLFTAILAISAVLTWEVRSNAVEVPVDRVIPTVEQLLQIVQLKLDQLFVEASEKVEELQTELYHLRLSVDHVNWVTNRIERAIQKVQLDNDVLVRNVTQLTSQTDNIILNQQYCANHEALKNLFFDLTPKCLGNPTSPPPEFPPTTTEAVPTETTASTTTTTPSSDLPETTTDFIVYGSCSVAPRRSGVYLLVRGDGEIFRGFCEQERFGGGLLVFQSRQDGSVDFNRSWADFEVGFGDPAGEYWLGLETLHQVASTARQLVIAMKNFSNVEAYEIYDNFWINARSDNYRIRFTSQGNGTAGDSLFSYYSETFTTYDRVTNENYRACNDELGSAFWHYACGSTTMNRNNLNGVYGLGKGRQGIWWGTFGNTTSQNLSPLKTVQMMVRY